SLGRFGITPTIPVIATGDDPAIRSALLRQASAALKTSAKRVAEFTALRAQAVATDARLRCDQLVERARAVFGTTYVVLPNFTCRTTAATELTSALAAGFQQAGGDWFAPYTWFARSSRVRDNLARLGTCLRSAEVLGTGDRLSLKVAQLPFVSTE